MKRYEYRTAYITFKVGKKREEHLLEMLNSFGRDGWRLNKFYGEFSWRNLASWKGGLNLLLEREIEEAPSNTCYNNGGPTP